MATLSIQTISEAGLNPSFVSASAGGDVFSNSNEERTILHVKNGGGGSVTVTIASQNTTPRSPGIGRSSRPDLQIAVPAGGERLIGPFPEGAFNTAAGQVSVTYSGVTSVTVAALKVPKQ